MRDGRVTIVHPSDADTVSLPLTVEWTARDFDGSFGIFVDRAPMRPGADLESLVPRDDRLCRADPSCPDVAWLAARGVYVTDRPSVTIDAVGDNRASGRQADHHELVLVLLDGEGRRTGEAAFIREFTVDRSSEP